MRTVSLFFLFVFFRIEASISRNLHKPRRPQLPSSPPKNVLHVTPLLTTSEDAKKAREEAVVKPFAGDVKSYAGYFTVHEHYHSNMYFWFFPSEKNNETAPVILWLHGGPAESAMMGLFEENGPYQLVNGSVTLREASWSKHYNVLYLDNPIGVGFSYTLTYAGYPQNIYEEAHFLYKALTQFYKMFPEYEKNAFYMAGQSFGSRCIPVLANLIHRNNNKTDYQKINLKGMMIGGGTLDPVNQIAFGHFIFEQGGLDRVNRDEMTNDEVRARCFLDSGYYGRALDRLEDIHEKIQEVGYKIPLDINDPHINMSTTYQAVENFVTNEDVRDEIHAGDVRFHNRKNVIWYLDYQYLRSVGYQLSMTVQLGYRVLLYAGQYDLVTPPEQIDRIIASINWKGSEQFRKAQVQPWYSHGELAGHKKSFANLQKVLVRKANHMIVRSQQKWMLDLVKSFAV